MKTVQQWLDLPKDERALEFAEVLTPGAWKHKYQNWTRHSEHDLIFHDRCCPKCGLCISVDVFRDRTSPWMISAGPTHTPCSVPDPITIDWNTAKYWQEKCDRDSWYAIMEEIYYTIPDDICRCPWEWVIFDAQPKHYLIAAAMAAERKE